MPFPVPEAAKKAAMHLTRWFQHETGRHRRCFEWFSLSKDSRRQLAADMHMSGAEVDAMVGEGHDSRELMRLLTRPSLRRLPYGLDVLRDMQRVCSFCPNHRRCQSWQEDASFAARWPAFCPNAYTFASLRRAAGARRSAGKLS